MKWTFLKAIDLATVGRGWTLVSRPAIGLGEARPLDEDRLYWLTFGAGIRAQIKWFRPFFYNLLRSTLMTAWQFASTIGFRGLISGLPLPFWFSFSLRISQVRCLVLRSLSPCSAVIYSNPRQFCCWWWRQDYHPYSQGQKPAAINGETNPRFRKCYTCGCETKRGWGTYYSYHWG